MRWRRVGEVVGTPEFDAGYRAGFAAGRQEGFAEGHRAGFFEGHRAGWEQGLRDAGVAPPAPVRPVQAPAPAQGPSRSAPPPLIVPAGPAASRWAPSAEGPPVLRPTAEVADARQAARRRAKRGVQNANIALYAASLLIVAAAALFLASGAADSARVTVLALVTALFYSAGLIVHSRVPRLRPAAVALTGTGLALLPVTGLAVDVILVHHPALTWLLTSVLGLVAFGAAAVRLESRILVYVSLTFAFSAAWSGAAALGGALAMDFATVLGLGAVLGALSALRPRWIPPIILRSVIRLHPFVAPSVFVAASVAWFALERWQYPALVVALCLYFAVSVVVRGPLVVRRFSWWFARVTAVVAAGSGVGQAAQAGMFGPGVEASDCAAIAAASVLALQVVATGLMGRRLAGTLSLSQRMVLTEQGLAVVGLFVIFLEELALRAMGVGGTPTALFAVSALATGAAQFVAWWHGRATEGLPVAAVAMVALAHDPLGSGVSALLSSLAALYWLARAVWPERPGGDVGGWDSARCAAAARLASLWMVPAVVDALLPVSVVTGERTGALATATALTGAAHLIGTAIAAGVGRSEFARGPVSGAMAAAAVAGSIVAAVAEPPSHWILHLVAVIGCCVAALAVATTLFDVPGAGGPRLRLGEWLPTLVLSTLSLGLIVGDRWGAANAALATLTVVCAASASRSSLLRRRWAFGWLSRGAGSALVLALFHALERDGWVLSLLGQRVTLWHILAMVSLAQLGVPLAAEARALRQTKRSFPWALEDAAIVLAVTAAACAALTPTRGFSLPGSTGPGPLTATAVVGFAMGAALVGFFLRRRPVALAIAPTAFVVSVLLAHVDLRLVEIITAVFSAYAAAMALVLRDRTIRGAHLVAARALPLLLVGLVAQDATASPTVVSVALALGLAAQHVVRRFMRSAADLPFQNAAYWSGIVAQLALPVLYAATSRGEAFGGRWVLLGESLLVVASVLLTLRDQPKAGYAGIAGLLIAWVSAGPAVPFPPQQFLAQPLLNGTALALTACLISTAHVAGMVLWDGVKRSSGRRLGLWPWTAGAGAFAIASVVAGLPEPAWVLGLGLAACSTALFAASGLWRHVAGVAEVSFPLASLLALAAGIAVGHSVFAHEVAPWGDVLAVLVGGVVPAGVGLAVRWGVVWATGDDRLAALARLGADPVRRWSLAGAAATALLMTARLCWEPPAAPVLPFLAVALVGLAVSEVPLASRRLTAELGLVVVVAAVQRAVFAGTAGESAFWLAQWYVVLAAVVALLRYIGHDQRLGAVWLATSAGLATLTGFVVALSADTPQQVWLLVAFAGLVGAGVAAGDRRFTGWGAIGVLACVLWAVRAYPYLLLGALGLALIGFAVWWLVRAPRGTLLP